MREYQPPCPPKVLLIPRAKVATQAVLTRQEVARHNGREGQNGLGKDQWDHAGHIDHQRQVTANRHRHAVTHPASREHHRNIPAALLNKDDREDGQTEDDQDDEDQPPAIA